MTTFKQKMKKIISGIVLVGALYTAKPMLAQEKKEEPKAQPGAVLILSPTYSATEKSGAFRIAGGGAIKGIGIGGFLDLYGTPEAPVDMQSHYGKVTVGKGLEKIVKGSGVAIELTTSSFGKDEIRAGVYKAGTLLGFSYKGQFYPIAPKGKGPSVGLFIDKQLGKKAAASAFITSDLGDKSYYGEAQVGYEIIKQLSLIIQERYGGKFGEPFKPATHVGFEIKM
ncbi:hypothetical protein JXB28_06110 [Candidatus Woesearchaeota archaeon]|nr:hypothetical protein [Candidatus Woesearchaeota archaeon]